MPSSRVSVSVPLALADGALSGGILVARGPSRIATSCPPTALDASARQVAAAVE